jgi:hypothetical protein
MFLEAAAGGLAKALITRVGADAGGAVLDKRRDGVALTKAIQAAAQATEAEHPGVLASYDVNVGFFEREGATELSRILLPGVGPEPRELADAVLRSLGGCANRGRDGALVVALGAFVDNLTRELGRHPPFRARLAEVHVTRATRASAADELEFVAWLVDRFSHLQTVGMGTTRHVQVALDDVYVGPRGLREQRAGLRWGTRAEEKLALLDEQLRAGELSREEYEAQHDRLHATYRPAREGEHDPVSVLEAMADADRVLILGEPGSGKTTLLRYLTLQHALALRDGQQTVAAQPGRPRIALYVGAGEFARHRPRPRLRCVPRDLPRGDPRVPHRAGTARRSDRNPPPAGTVPGAHRWPR